MVFSRTESVQQIIISPFWRTALFLRFIIPVADFIDNSGLFSFHRGIKHFLWKNLSNFLRDIFSCEPSLMILMLHTIFILHPTILTFHKSTKYLKHNQRSKVWAKQKHRIDCDCCPMLQSVKWWMEISKGIKLANCRIARSILILDVEIIPILILRARFLINQKLRNLLTYQQYHRLSCLGQAGSKLSNA